MKEKGYQERLRLLHGELVAMQERVRSNGAKICVVFAGRETARKGGTIKAIAQHHQLPAEPGALRPAAALRRHAAEQAAGEGLRVDDARCAPDPTPY